MNFNFDLHFHLSHHLFFLLPLLFLCIYIFLYLFFPVLSLRLFPLSTLHSLWLFPLTYGMEGTMTYVFVFPYFSSPAISHCMGPVRHLGRCKLLLYSFERMGKNGEKIMETTIFKYINWLFLLQWEVESLLIGNVEYLHAHFDVVEGLSIGIIGGLYLWLFWNLDYRLNFCLNWILFYLVFWQYFLLLD